MEYYVKSVIPIIESNYDKFTTTEKTIADFFIHNQKKMDFSVNHIAELLYTSKATLTRFAQKCGYHGYKEFIYQYEETFVEKQEKITGNTRMVLNAYQELLNKTYSLVDESQVVRIIGYLNKAEKVICVWARKFRIFSKRDGNPLYANRCKCGLYDRFRYDAYVIGISGQKMPCIWIQYQWGDRGSDISAGRVV